MQVFGMTNPCAEIARHFGVNQAFVYVSMEWALYEKGIRSHRPDHTALYWHPSMLPDDGEVRRRVNDAVDGVVFAIRADAEKRRRAEAERNAGL